MEIDEYLQTALHLSPNEAKVYKALLKANLSVATIAEQTELPRSRVYDILNKLSSTSLIEKIDRGSYRVISPRVALSSKIKKVEQQYNQQIQKYSALSDYLDKVWRDERTDNFSPGIQLLHLVDAEVFYFEDLHNVMHRLYIAASDQISLFDWRKSGQLLVDLQRKNIDIRYLFNDGKLKNKVQHKFASSSKLARLPFKFMYCADLSTSFMIIDDMFYMFFVNPDDALQVNVLRTSGPSFLQQMLWMYEQMWNRANERDQ